MKLIRYTSAEVTTVADHARACGLPFARYVRETSLGVVPRIRRSQANAKLIRQLAHIGNNLNQLAHVANATGRIVQEAALTDAVKTVLATIARID